MLRGLLIVICSAALAGSLFAQSARWVRGNNISPYLEFTPGPHVGGAEIRIAFNRAEGGVFYFVKNQNGGFFNFADHAGTGYANTVASAQAFQAQFPYASQGVAEFRLSVNGQFSEWATNVPSLVTNSFSWTFGPEWAGTILQVRATNGTSLGTWGLPSVIGSNYVLSASIVTNQSLLTGAQVFLDGVPAAVLATAGTNSNLEAFADRPGYALSFGGDYQGGEWQIRRSDGSVAGTGSAATLGTVSSGRVTLLPEGDTGTIWTRVPAGDGMGSAWVNSGITVSGNNVTTYNFAAAPAPTPLPTPAFQTNAPAPTITNAPAPTTPGTNTTAPAPVATNDVTVDVDELQPIPTDSGEQAALDGIHTASEKLRGILDDFRGAFENVAMTFNEFRKFSLGGVGTVCTFEIGGVTINLSNIVPGWLRNGMKLAILIVALFSMIRYTWETFS